MMFGFVANSYAQILSDKDSVGSVFTLNPEIESEIIKSYITNNTFNDTLIWTRVNNNVPEGWFTAACTEATCFFPETETGIMVIKQGETALFSAYIYPQEIEGSGEVWFSFKPKYSNDSIVVKFSGQAQKPNATEKELIAQFGVFPTRFSSVVHTYDKATNYQLYDLNGNLVEVPTTSNSFHTNVLQSGIYVIRHKSGLVQRLVKE